MNFVQLTMPLTTQPEMRWKWKADGRLHPPESGVKITTPWRTANFTAHGYDCRWEHSILHDVVFRKQAVPEKCMNCYKVTVFLDSLTDVYAVEGFQQRGEGAAKVGAETRMTVKGRKFGAYWYCKGLKDGRERFIVVKRWCGMSLGGKWSAVLKRGCTEFEQAMGPSDQWVYTEAHRKLEDEAERLIAFEPGDFTQFPELVDQIHAVWEEWARLTRAYKTYEEE